METVKTFLVWLIYLVFGLAGTGIVIFIHELGHFLAARILGVSVEIFSFGFGRPLFSFCGKKTEFRISIIPFGGYCRMGGSEDLSVALANNEKKIHYAEEGSLFAVNPVKKLLIYLAGPAMNILLAYLLFTLVSLIPVERISTRAVVAPVSDYPLLFSFSSEEIPVKKGDFILEADGNSIEDFEDLSEYLGSLDGRDTELTLLRNGERIALTLKSFLVDGKSTYGITDLVPPVIGRSEDERIHEGDRITEANGKDIEYDKDLFSIEGDEYELTLNEADGKGTYTVTLHSPSFPFSFESDIRLSRDTHKPLKKAWERTGIFLDRTVKAIMKLMTLQFGEALREISGPVSSASSMGRISVMAFGTSAPSGFRTVFYLLAVVSISICVGNLIPIPTFDGGQILICLAEMIYRRPLRPKAYLILHITGLVTAWTIVIIMNLYPFLEKIFN